MDQFDEHLKDINRSFGEQLRVADQKAAYILTVVLAFVVTSAEAKAAFNVGAYRTLPALNVIVNLSLVLSVTFAMICAVSTIMPRIGRGGTTLYWGAWPSAGQTLVEARKGSSADFLFEERLRSTEALASICARKFALIRLSIGALFVAVASYGALLMLRI